MKLVFWFSLFIVFYAYFAYPAWLLLRSRLKPKPVGAQQVFPKVSIIMAVRNEEKSLEQKLDNLQHLDYPVDLMEAIVVSDASTDRTNAILSALGDPRMRAILLPLHSGKSAALNRALEVAAGDIVVFTDARQRIAVDSLKALVGHFSDPGVGCVSGALMLGSGDAGSLRGVGSYWKFEKSVRFWESTSGSTVGATGALYAARRSLVPRLPTGLVLDDLFIPMTIARSGARVIFEPKALAWDNLPARARQEFRRKVRTLFGNYQLVRLAPWLLTAKNPLLFEFISHKLCRLAVPFAIIAAVLVSPFLNGLIYRLPLIVALGIAILSILAAVRIPLGMLSRLTDLALAFVLLNTAAVVAFYCFASGKKQVWVQ